MNFLLLLIVFFISCNINAQNLVTFEKREDLLNAKKLYVDENYEDALTILRNYSRDVDSMNLLGVMYRDGKGVPKNKLVAYLVFLYVSGKDYNSDEIKSREYAKNQLKSFNLTNQELKKVACFNLDYFFEILEKGSNAQMEKTTIYVRNFDFWKKQISATLDYELGKCN
jgi:TPR repeat protein